MYTPYATSSYSSAKAHAVSRAGGRCNMTTTQMSGLSPLAGRRRRLEGHRHRPPLQMEQVMVIGPARCIYRAFSSTRRCATSCWWWRHGIQCLGSPAVGVVGVGSPLLECGYSISQIGDAPLQIGPPRCQVIQAGGDCRDGHRVGLHRGGELVRVGPGSRIHVLQLQLHLAKTSCLDELRQNARREGWWWRLIPDVEDLVPLPLAGPMGKPGAENTRSCLCKCPALNRLMRMEDNTWYIADPRESHNHSPRQTLAR
ncbi:uncharacterized protein [Triticum aestivum]|uniref:uncharacterized protein n=1 Tax=Triticum aestivum TaxID=4565 RepID=UPI001D006FE9|nr:uncharacterized protein LOC123168155 [Triticum aestivum]